MRKNRFFLVILFTVTSLMCGMICVAKPVPRVLVFGKTAGYHHASIADGMRAIQKLGMENGFEVDTTTNAAWFTDDSLKHYAAVIFMSTTHDVLDKSQQACFERYIHAGGGFVGVHAAADGGYTWPWYGQLVGAYFKSHTACKAALRIHRDKKFPVTRTLPNPWVRYDEWYNFREIPKDVHVLVDIDETSYKGGENGADHPMVWYHSFDGGRAFYMALGHTNESYREPEFVQLLLAGIRYAMDGNKKLHY
jgi:type 1 glutamine amidotransferase